jgi:hypothetical protein
MSPAETRDPPRPRALIVVAAALLALALLGIAVDAPASVPLTITASAGPAEIPLGAAVTVSGMLTGEPAQATAQSLQLEAAPYPFHTFTVIARAGSASDGSFVFPSSEPQENTRLRVALANSPAVVSPVVQVTVDPRVAIAERSLGPGRVRLSIRVVHTSAARTRATSVFWYLAPRGSPIFVLAGTSSSRELAAGVTYASVILDPPARRFNYRVCLNPDWEAAMGLPSSHGGCPARNFRLTDGR